MSIESLAIALHHSQASGTAKLVLLGIANHDGDAGSFPKTATLARYANVHPRRVPEALAKLIELGEVKVHVKEGGSRSLRSEICPNLYELTLACPPNCDRTSQHNLLGEDGRKLTYGRSYKGAQQHREKPVDNSPQDAVQDVPGPGDDSSPSDGNSTRSSDGNSTSPSDGNSTTKNHQKNHTMNPALVPSVTREIHSEASPVEKSRACEDGMCELCQWAGCEDACHGGIRAIVPALPRAKPGNNDATRKTNIDPLGLTEEQKSRNSRGAAMARAALRGESPFTEAKDQGKP